MPSSTATVIPTIERIGWTAGRIWHLLDTDGPLSISRIIRDIDEPRDMILQAIGWLAREGKIAIEDDARSRVVSLQ